MTTSVGTDASVVVVGASAGDGAVVVGPALRAVVGGAAVTASTGSSKLTSRLPSPLGPVV